MYIKTAIDTLSDLKAVRESVENDRAVLRAMHFINDNLIAQEEAGMLGVGVCHILSVKPVGGYEVKI